MSLAQVLFRAKAVRQPDASRQHDARRQHDASRQDARAATTRPQDGSLTTHRAW
jgi:hypothetical protein